MSTQVFPSIPGGGGGGGTPATTVVTETSYGQASAVGTSTDYARADHTHGTPPSPTSAAGWTNGGTAVYLTTSTDQVAIGTPTPVASTTVTVENSATIQGQLVRASGGTAEPAYRGRNSADTVDRLAVSTGGVMVWGGGSAAGDVQMSRTGTTAFAFASPVGSTAIVWTMSGTLLTASRRVAVTTVTAATFSMVSATTFDVVLCDPTAAPQTITLPSPSATGNTGRRYTIKRSSTSANTVTVVSTAGNIDGAANRVLAGGTYDAITVVNDGTNWWIV